MKLKYPISVIWRRNSQIVNYRLKFILFTCSEIEMFTQFQMNRDSIINGRPISVEIIVVMQPTNVIQFSWKARTLAHFNFPRKKEMFIKST